MAEMAQLRISLATFRAIEAQRLSFGESHDAIVRRALGERAGERSRAATIAIRSLSRGVRRRGALSVDLFGRVEGVANLRAAYVIAIASLVHERPSLYELLEREGSARRRWIARAPEALYIASPHLALEHAHKIAPGWWLDTNLSKQQIVARLTRACRLAGYNYGRDVRIVEGAV